MRIEPDTPWDSGPPTARNSADSAASEAEKLYAATMANEVIAECRRAQLMYGPYPSGKHGLEACREELEELAEEVRKRKPNKSRMREEAIQLCAAAMQFVTDVCD